MEIWKPLRNFPSYNGSTEGRIMNVRTQRILKTYTDSRGYEKLTLRKNNIPYTVKVARAIAETFLGEHPGMDVRHKDNDRSNCRPDNLEWVTRQELIQDAFVRGTKKPSRQTAVRVVETGEVYDSIRECARQTDCAQSEIVKYLKGLRPHVKKLHFERV